MGAGGAAGSGALALYVMLASPSPLLTVGRATQSHVVLTGNQVPGGPVGSAALGIAVVSFQPLIRLVCMLRFTVPVPKTYRRVHHACVHHTLFIEPASTSLHVHHACIHHLPCPVPGVGHVPAS